MEEIIYDLLLNVKHSGCRQKVILKYGEMNVRKLRIKLTNGSFPIMLNQFTDTVIIRGVKSDKTIVYNTGTITKEGNIEYTLANTETFAKGESWYEIQVIRNDIEDIEKKILFTTQFKVEILDILFEDEKVTSTNEMGVLLETIDNVKKWMKEKELEIDDRTLTEVDTFQFDESDNTTPDKKHETYNTKIFTSGYIETDCEYLRIENMDSKRTYLVFYRQNDNGEDEEFTTAFTDTNNTEYIIDVHKESEIKFEIRGKGPYNANPETCKFHRVKYITSILDEIKNKLNDYVPTTRQIANLSLDDDITIATLSGMLFPEILYKGKSVIKSYCSEDFTPLNRKIATLNLSKDITADEFLKAITSNAEDGGQDLWTFLSEHARENDIYNLLYKLKDVVSAQNLIKQMISISDYALTENTYSKQQIDVLINAIKQFNVEKVEKLPQTGQQLTIYLVPKRKEDNNNYDEYIWINEWEHIGTTAVDLSNYVTKTRKVAGYSLESDIDANMLAGTIAHEFTKGGSWYSELMPWLEQKCGSRKQQDTNTQDIKELKKKDEWELILDKALSATSSDGTLINFDDLELKGEYKELRFVTVMWNTALEHVQLYVNEMQEPLVTLKSVLGSGATYSYDFTLSNDKVFPGRYLVMNLKRSQTGANASNCTENSFANSSTDENVKNVESITSLKLVMTAGWQNSTERYIRVFGRK